MINSRDWKKQLVKGQTYFTFRMETSKKGDQIRNYTNGIIEVKFKGVSPNYDYYYEWEILPDQPKFAESVYLESYLHSGHIPVFVTRSEAEIEHDRKIVEYALGQDTNRRETFYKKLIHKTNRPPVDDLEANSLKWLKSLPLEERKYIQWIKDVYAGDIISHKERYNL